MKSLRFCILILLLFPRMSQGESVWIEAAPGYSALPEMPTGWSLLPRSRPFGILPSDPRDLHLGLFKNSLQRLEADVGGYRSILGWRGDDGCAFHFGIEGAAYFQMAQQGSKFPLESSDGLVGLYAETAKGPWAYQLRYTHISAHLSDGLFGARAPILYTREFLAVRAARSFSWVRPYLGYQFLTHTAPVLPRSALEFGAYAIPPAHWGALHPYLGADLRLRSADEGTTYELGAGGAFLSSGGAPPLLVTATYLKGHDLRGQFYNESISKWTFGIELAL